MNINYNDCHKQKQRARFIYTKSKKRETFLYRKGRAPCKKQDNLRFCEVFDFFYIKISRNAKCHDFCI